MPLTEILFLRKVWIRARPNSSSPTRPTGRAVTPRAARFMTALAPPPGIRVRPRCLRISTGASRETRAISPEMNSSVIRSAMTSTLTLENDSTMRRSFCAPVSPWWSVRFFASLLEGVFWVRAIAQGFSHGREFSASRVRQFALRADSYATLISGSSISQEGDVMCPSRIPADFCAEYQSRTDEELLQLWVERSGLLPAAEVTLQNEIAQRGLTKQAAIAKDINVEDDIIDFEQGKKSDHRLAPPVAAWGPTIAWYWLQELR